MKVLHFIYDHVRNPWVGGGGAVRAREIYKRLACRHQITMVCGKYPGARDHEEGNVKIHFEGTGVDNYALSTFCYAFSAAQFLRRNCRGCDVVIEDFAPWNPLFSFRIGTDAPVMLQIQNYLGKEMIRKYKVLGLPFYLIEKYYPLKFENTVVVNKSLAVRYGLSRSYSLSNGIDDDLLRADVLTGGDYIGYMGRIDIYQKGLDILEEAMKWTPVKLRLAGDGRDREKFLRRMQARCGAEWAGVVKGSEKVDFLSKARLIVVPSRYEGQGIVVLEAAACGKPVVVSDIPELRYAVDAGFGLAFRSGDPRDLAEKMGLLLGSESMRADMGRRGRKFAERYSWDRIAADYECYLQELMRGYNR
jgi:glycosyltransferase involved in cell wall biosynthesis